MPLPVPSFTTVRIGRGVNVALQVVSVVGMVTVIGVAVPEQPTAVPVQVVNREPASGVAVNTTGVPAAYGSEQFATVTTSQVIPAGAEVTVPVPVPSFTTNRTGRSVKVAVQVTEALGIVTVAGVASPAQPDPPAHPAKTESDAGVAVKTTGRPGAYGSEQSCVAVPVQSVPTGAEIPTGAEVTVPVPLPDFTMVRTGRRSNIAVQVVVGVIGIVIVIGVTVPVQPSVPVQPTKIESGAGVAVNTTGVAGAYDSEHAMLGTPVAGQSVASGAAIPAGAEVTVPLPVPFFTTASTGKRLNCAVQVSAVVGIVTVIGKPVPEQPSVPVVHPAKNESSAGVAVNTTGVPGA